MNPLPGAERRRTRGWFLLGLLSLFLWLSDGISGQTSQVLPVDTLMIVGNEKTRDEIILREIPFQFPARLTEKDLLLIQQRLYNLFLFSRVQLAYQQLANGKQALVILLEEGWYLYPLPVFFINDRDWSKLSYGFQLTHINFRGRHEQVTLGGWLGYNAGFLAEYRNPWLGRKTRLILEVQFFARRIANRVEDFDEKHLGMRLGLGKRLNHDLSLKGVLSLRRIKLPREYLHYSFSGSQTDFVPQFGLEVKYDHRDLYEFPHQGSYLSWRLIRSGVNQHQPNFWRLETDHRIYVPLHNRLTLAARNFSQFQWGSLPIYDRLFIGYDERIRGYFQRVFSGRYLTLHNAELRYTILPIRHYSLSGSPILSSMVQNFKFGLSAALFLDSGLVWNRAEEFSLPRHYTGYGIGLHVHLPFVQLLRVNYAVNDRGATEWIVEGGVAF